MAGNFDGYWEMKEGGPHDEGTEVFKCTDCCASTPAGDDWKGEPVPHACKDGCSNKAKATADSDWNPCAVSKPYLNNYERTFGHE